MTDSEIVHVSRSPAELDPWLTLWTRPRETIRHLIDHRPGYGVLLLAALSGISSSLGQSSNRNTGDQFGLGTILLVAVVFGPLFGILLLYFAGWLVSVTGRWLGGDAPPAHVRTAIAWGSLPNVAGLLLWIPAIALAGRELFTSEAPELASHPLLALLLVPVGLGWITLAVWGLVATVQGLGEAHGFSAWRALGSLALALLLIVTGVALLVMLLVVLGLGAL